MPGAGKSFLGKKLADELNYTFYDLDEVIERAHKMNIPDIFSKYGQEFFRNEESRLLDELLNDKDDFVLSTGGGAPCFHQNMEKINQKGLSIYLKVSISELLSRVTRKKDKRPLFMGKSDEEIENFLEDMIKAREVFYHQAIITQEKDFSDVKEVLMKVRQHLKEKSN